MDRATDALRHAVFAGAAPLGGVVAVVGDDPSAKSSTIPSSSAGVLSDMHMPVLYPRRPGRGPSTWAATPSPCQEPPGCGRR